jgi:hypothetical protein
MKKTGDLAPVGGAGDPAALHLPLRDERLLARHQYSQPLESPQTGPEMVGLVPGDRVDSDSVAREVPAPVAGPAVQVISGKPDGPCGGVGSPSRQGVQLEEEGEQELGGRPRALDGAYHDVAPRGSRDLRRGAGRHGSDRRPWMAGTQPQQKESELLPLHRRPSGIGCPLAAPILCWLLSGGGHAAVRFADQYTIGAKLRRWASRIVPVDPARGAVR